MLPGLLFFAQRTLLSGLALLCFAVPSWSQGRIADRMLKDFTVSNASMFDVAVRLSGYNVPTGFEVFNGLDNQIVSIDLHHITVAQVLNAAIQGDPHYQWQESDGVIDIFSAKVSQSPLNIGIRYFEANGDTGASALIGQLLDTSSVKNYLLRHKMQAGVRIVGAVLVTPLGPGQSSTSIHGQIPHPFVIQNKTFRQALNQLLTESGMVYWGAYYSQQDAQPTNLWFQVW